MTTADEYMRAVRRGDEPTQVRLRSELVTQGYSREEIRDLWEVFGVSIPDKVAIYDAAARRAQLAELARVLDGTP
jgi:hypothetical protein